MSSRYIRVAAILAVAAAAAWPPNPLVAQHEHHETAGAGRTNANQVLVTGRVLCVEGPTLAGAVVQVFHVSGPERHLMAGVLSDRDGRFAVRVEPGEYVLHVGYIGHVDHAATISPAAGALALGDVRMRPSAIVVEGITVSAERAAVRLRSGATVVDGQAATAAGGSVADLLRTVPGLEIEPDGRISLRGSTGVQVLVNGRRVPLAGDALIAFLKQMPATALERIEAGTTAAASLEADGAAGVVNLVFHEHTSDLTGLRSVAASAATEDHYMVSGAATGQTRAAVSWDVAYSFSSMRPRTQSGTRRRSLLEGEPIRLSEQESLARARHRLHSVMAGATARLTPSTSLGGRGSLSWMAGVFDNTTLFEDADASGASVTRTTASLLEHTIPARDGALEVRWVGGPEARVRFRSELAAGLVTQDFTGAYRDGAGAAFLATTMSAGHREVSIANDLAFDLGSAGIEVGQRSARRTIDVAYETTAAGVTGGHAFAYEDWIHAAYASADRTLGPASVRAGLRAELERATVAWEQSETSKAARVFPSLDIQWAGADGHRRLRLAYGRRINRPESAALNPYSMGEDDMNSVVGNPRLRAEVVDQLELGLERQAAGGVVQLTPFVRVTRDPIRPLKSVTESGRATTTLHNLERTFAAGADASIRARLGSRVTATLSGSLFRMETAGLEYENRGLYLTTRAHVDVDLGAGTALQLYGYRRGAQAIEQGEILPGTTTELALTHRWGEDQRGRLTLRISDPFGTEELAYVVREPDFVQESHRRVSRPLASLFVSWAIGGSPREDGAGRREEAEPTIF